jgi:predicted ATPase
MKIVISGPQGCGKSTLLKAIEDSGSFNDCVFIKEIVRTLAKQGVQINKGADHNSQCKILEQHYKNAISIPKFITDRGAIDAFSYATWDYLENKYTYEQHKQHEALCLETLKQYDLHFYLPIEFVMEEDGVRDTDLKYQKKIEELFFENYKRLGIEYFKLTGSVENRLYFFKQFVRIFK